MQSKPKYFIIAILIVLITLTAWYLKTIILYIIISTILSLLGQPLVNLLSKIHFRKKHISRTMSSIGALIIMLTVIVGLISLFIPLIVEQARIISQINPNKVIDTFKEPLKNLDYSLQKFQVDNSSEGTVEKFLTEKLPTIFGFSQISAIARQMVSFTGGIIAAFFSISFMTFFFMKDEHLVYNIILLLTPPKHIEAVKDIMRSTKLILTRYFIGILMDMAFVATLTATGLSIFGLKNALLIGLFAGILNVVPYLGPLLGAGFAILIGILGNLDLDFYTQLIPLIEKIALTFLIIQLIDAFFFQPLVISNRVKAHPLEIFLVILTAGTIAGITGMVAAIPIYTIIRIIAKEFLNNFKIVQQLTAEIGNATGKK
jgi:predicted PurR-regulated permease PerM